MTAEQLRERLRVRLQDGRGALLNALANAVSLREDYGQAGRVEELVRTALDAVETTQREVRVLPPEERFDVAISTLADALDPTRLGVDPLNAPDVREAAQEVLDARHDLLTAQRQQQARTGDGSIPHEDEDLTGCPHCGAAQGEGHAAGCTASA